MIPTLAFQVIYPDIYFDILPNVLPDIYSDILSGISSSILSSIYFGVLSGIYFGILCGILSTIYFSIPCGILWGIYSGNLLAYILAVFLALHLAAEVQRCPPTGLGRSLVEVQRCQLRSEPGGWGPAVPTQIGSRQLRSNSAHCARKLAKRLATSW